jgi:hypothetical protein
VDIKTNITKQDLVEFQLFQLIHGRGSRLRKLVIAFVPPLLIMGALFALIVQSATRPIQSSKDVFPLLLILPLYLWLLYRLTCRRLTAQLDASLKAGHGQSLVGDFHVTLTTDGVVTVSPLGEEIFRRWEEIPRVIANGDYGYIYTAADHAIIVPQRCFSQNSYFRAYVKAAVIYHYDKETAATASATQPPAAQRPAPSAEQRSLPVSLMPTLQES